LKYKLILGHLIGITQYNLSSIKPMKKTCKFPQTTTEYEEITENEQTKRKKE